MQRIFSALILCLFGFAAHAGQDIRLTLEQGTPVTSADIAGANSVCLEPYKSPHNQLTTFDGTNWNSIDVARATYCLSTSGLIANTNYDIVVSAAGGLPVLSWSPAYVDDTHPPTRAWQDGVEVLASDHTKLVIGGCHINALVLCADSHVCRCLSNYYQPEPREMSAQDLALTWVDHSPSTGFELAHGNAANQLELFTVIPRLITVHVEAQSQVSGASGGNAMVGIGLNGSLGDVSFPHLHASMWSNLGGAFPTTADYIGNPGGGHITASWLERAVPSTTPATITWLGMVPPWNDSGISGMVMN